LDELAEGRDARVPESDAGGDHGYGVAQDEADGGTARGATRHKDADLARSQGRDRR
jgi:hypothetical protein